MQKEQVSLSTLAGYTTWTFPNGTQSVPHTFGPRELIASIHKISYERGPRGIDKNCSHFVCDSTFTGPLTGLYRINSSNWQTLVMTAPAHWFGVSFFNFVNVEVDPAADSFDALTAMSPSMSTGVSLTNFLLELGDVKSLFKLWSRRKSLITNVANGNLNLNFGWKPFIGDIKKLVQGIITFEDRLREFIKRADTNQTRRYKHPLDSQSFTSIERIYDMWGTAFDVQRITEITNPVYHAKMSYTYKLPCYSYDTLWAYGLLDTLGLTLKPSQIYEAIPFSFIIDWFVKVGDFLENNEEDLTEPELRIMHFLHSYKFVGKQTVNMRLVSPDGTINSWCHVASHSYRNYWRAKAVPSTVRNVDGTLSFFSDWKKIGLAASLVASRR